MKKITKYQGFCEWESGVYMFKLIYYLSLSLVINPNTYMSQADNTMFNAMTNEQDMFGDPKEGDLLESIDRNSTQIRHVCAALV